MSGEVGEFRWAAQPGSYQWRTATVVGEGESHSQTDLWAGVFDGPVPPVRRYSPLREQTALFQVFADTPPTPEGIRQFADRFGMLLDATVTLTPPESVRGGRRGRLKDTLAPCREGYEIWRSEVVRMREAVRVWQSLERADLDALGRHVRWLKGEGKERYVEYDSHPELPAGVSPPEPDLRTTEVVASPTVNAEQFSSLRPGDVVRPARLLLRRWVNEHLQGQLRILVTLDDDGELRVATEPSNLLAAMWLQFAQAAAEHKQYRECTVCGTPFELSPETARTNRRFCSIACKNKAFRSRQDQARRMHAEGKTAEQIAEELGATVKVVEGWIATKERG